MASNRSQPVQADASAGATIAGQGPGRLAFWLLRISYTVAPILAGLDKFFHWIDDHIQSLPG